MIARDFVKQMTDDELQQIWSDYDLLEETGITFDSLLRKKTEELMKMAGNPDGVFIIWSEFLMKEVFRRFAIKYVNFFKN
jgi:hypothetical protein